MLVDAQDMSKAVIMMVDDEPITMDVVQTFLEEFGYVNFVQVEDSLKAMGELEDCSPDILLLDLIMPGRSGLEILSDIRSHPRHRHLPVIVLTASSDAQDKLNALELGATDFLAKPVDQSELGLRVRNTLAAKAYLDQLVYYDPVTKLPNINRFEDRFEWSLARAKRFKEKLALLNISIDNFAKVNASIGPEGCNEVLFQLAKRLKDTTRRIDALGATTTADYTNSSLYRVEGSGFILLVNRVESTESVALIAQRVLQNIKEPLFYENSEMVLSGSIGIATYPEEGSDCQTLRQLTISAKDQSIQKGGDCFQFSSQAINDTYRKQLKLENQLRKAVDKGELVLHYQPKIDIKTNTIDGIEALVRWHHPELGLVSPATFIPLAEETKLIIPIGEWVLSEACKTQNRLASLGKQPLVFSVNVSPVQLDDPKFFTMVKETLLTTQANPNLIELEITESYLHQDIEQKIALLYDIKSLGLRLSMDDFGTGFSSLSYLSKLPVDELKIDKSFIDDVETSNQSRAIVSSIIYMAHSLNLCTTAEGIETKKQLDFIQQENCQRFQGYFFSKPLPFEDLIKIIV